MRNKATAFFEVIWFVMGGLMLFIAVDVSLSNGIKESWYYFVFAILALGMYLMRRNTRLKRP